MAVNKHKATIRYVSKRLFRYRRYWMPVAAYVLVASIHITDSAFPIPTLENTKRPLVSPPLMTICSIYTLAALLLAGILFLWWVIEPIWTAKTWEKRMLIIGSLFGGCILLTGAGLWLGLRDLSDAPKQSTLGSVDLIDSARAGEYVYDLAFVPLYVPHPEAYASMDYDAYAYWFIYRCDSLGIICEPIYHSDQFFYPSSWPLRGLGASMTYNASIDQLQIRSSTGGRSMRVVIEALDHASQADPVPVGARYE